LYDVDNDTTILEIESAEFARFSPDSRTIVYSSGRPDSSIVFHDILTGEREYIEKGNFETRNDILAFF
jgi:Tol biopolymer transport system component